MLEGNGFGEHDGKCEKQLVSEFGGIWPLTNLHGPTNEELRRRIPKVEVRGLEDVARRPHQHHRDRHAVRRFVPVKVVSNIMTPFLTKVHRRLNNLSHGRHELDYSKYSFYHYKQALNLINLLEITVELRHAQHRLHEDGQEADRLHEGSVVDQKIHQHGSWKNNSFT